MLCIGLTSAIFVIGKLVFVLPVNNVSHMLVNFETATSVLYFMPYTFLHNSHSFQGTLQDVKCFSNIENPLKITPLTKQGFLYSSIETLCLGSEK